MKWLLFAALALAAVNAQSYPFDRLIPGNCAPDCLFILALFAALYLNFFETFAVCWLAGLAQDLFSGLDFHVHTLIFPLLGLSIYFIRDGLFKGHPATRFLLALTAYMVYETLFLFLLKSVAVPSLPTGHYWSQGWGIALYTAALTPLAFPILTRIFRMFRVPLERSLVAGE